MEQGVRFLRAAQHSGRRDQHALCMLPQMHHLPEGKGLLEERAIPYEFRDIKLDNPKKEELREWQHRSGLP